MRARRQLERRRSAPPASNSVSEAVMRVLPAVIVSLVLAGACADGPVQPSGGTVDVAVATSLATIVPDVEQRVGTVGPGALYALYKPAAWNGRLVVYAHGYVAPEAPVALPEVDPLRDALLMQGVAVAYSSYSENGYALKDGVQRTRQVRELFAERFGEPAHSYLLGHSLGGAVSVVLAEKNPELWSGVLPMCGVVGGSQLEFDYLFNVRVLFDYYFPGALPGDAVTVPAELDWETEALPAIVTAIGTHPERLVEMAQVAQSGLGGMTMEDLGPAVVQALWFQLHGTNDVLGRARGGIPFDNTTTDYVGSSDDAALNAGVQRIRGTRQGERFAAKWFEPTGRLSVPTIMLHTTRDPVVPFAHEAAYADAASVGGGSAMLVQRSVDAFGHCTFSAEDQFRAIQDLIVWAEYGLKPAP
jgi:pimeloyl-ACP methyl ester carboxylesterase